MRQKRAGIAGLEFNQARRDLDAFERLIIATDTPTGSGIMPLGMLYTMSHLASLGGVAVKGLFLTERQDTTARGINPTPVKRSIKRA